MWPPVLTDDVRLEKPSEKKKTYFLLQLGVKQIQMRHPVIWKFCFFLIIKKHRDMAADIWWRKKLNQAILIYFINNQLNFAS